MRMKFWPNRRNMPRGYGVGCKKIWNTNDTDLLAAGKFYRKSQI